MKRIFFIAIYFIALCAGSYAAMQNIGGLIPYPSPYPASSTSRNLNTFASCLMGASSDTCKFVIQVPQTGTITGASFRTATVTAFGATSQLKIGLYQVNRDTQCSTTAYGSMSDGTTTAGSLTSNTWYDVNLGGNASATQGDFVCVHVRYNVFNAGDIANVATADVTNWSSGNPFSINNLGTKATGSLLTGLSYNGTYYPTWSVLPIQTFTEAGFNVNSSPDEQGSKITVPFKCRAVGAWFYAAMASSTTITLYDSDGTTPLTSVNISSNTSAGTANIIHHVMFPSSVLLSANVAYRVTILPNGTSNDTFASYSVATAALMAESPGGSSVVYSSRTNAGAWSDNATRKAMIGLLIDQLDDAAGGAATTHGAAFIQ